MLWYAYLQSAYRIRNNNLNIYYAILSFIWQLGFRNFRQTGRRIQSNVYVHWQTVLIDVYHVQRCCIRQLNGCTFDQHALLLLSNCEGALLK